MEYHYDNLAEKLNLLTLHIRHHHVDALFLTNIFSGAKCCPSVGNSWHPCSCSECTYVTLPCSTAPQATALEINLFLLQMQFVNLQIFLKTRLNIINLN
jgi:hypothetical protein